MKALLFLAFAASAQAATKQVEIKDPQSKVIAKQFVQESGCARLYSVQTITEGSIDRREVVVSHTIVLRSKTNFYQYFAIKSGRKGGLGYGLMEVGAYSLPKCPDYTER